MWGLLESQVPPEAKGFPTGVLLSFQRVCPRGPLQTVGKGCGDTEDGETEERLCEAGESSRARTPRDLWGRDLLTIPPSQLWELRSHKDPLVDTCAWKCGRVKEDGVEGRDSWGEEARREERRKKGRRGGGHVVRRTGLCRP